MIIGVVGALVGAGIAAWATLRASGKQDPEPEVVAPLSPSEQATRPLGGRLIDVVDDVREDAHLDLDAVANESGKAVIFYNRPFRIQVVRVEYFVEDRDLVFLSDRNTRVGPGLKMTNDVGVNFVKAKEVTMIRLSGSDGPVLSQFVVPLYVYQSSNESARSTEQ